MDIALRPAERAIYLELDHYLQAMDMKARKKTRGGEKGDRDKRLALVSAGVVDGEEALIKRCAKFELDDDAGHALRTCQDIIDVRQKQLEECKEDGQGEDPGLATSSASGCRRARRSTWSSSTTKTRGRTTTLSSGRPSPAARAWATPRARR